MYLSNVMFELEFNRGRMDEGDDSDSRDEVEGGQIQVGASMSPEPGARNILLKGQMKYIDDIKAIVFLCSPV